MLRGRDPLPQFGERPIRHRHEPCRGRWPLAHVLALSCAEGNVRLLIGSRCRRWAISMASARVEQPSFWKMAAMCLSTPWREMPMPLAISLLGCPSAILCRTESCFSVRPGASSRSLIMLKISASKNESPAITLRMALRMSCAADSFCKAPMAPRPPPCAFPGMRRRTTVSRFSFPAASQESRVLPLRHPFPAS